MRYGRISALLFFFTISSLAMGQRGKHFPMPYTGEALEGTISSVGDRSMEAVTAISFGEHYGECKSWCWTTYEAAPDPFKANEYLVKKVMIHMDGKQVKADVIKLSRQDWNGLVLRASLNQFSLIAGKTFGCPGCNDGGVFTVRISGNKGTQADFVYGYVDDIQSTDPHFPHFQANYLVPLLDRLEAIKSRFPSP